MAPKIPPESALPETLLKETRRLRTAWQRHAAVFLDSYLVQDVEDPRINIQSILTRHFLLKTLFGNRYTLIMEHEVYFALTVNWLLSLLKSQPSSDTVQHQIGEVLHELLADKHARKTSIVPAFLAAAFDQLAFPNYISDLLMWVPRETDAQKIPDYLLNIFQTVWAETLAQEEAEPIRILEAGCGSANDYRFLAHYGLARFLKYTGIDLSAKNIRNAKIRFPDIDFRVGSIFEVSAEDQTFDYCFVHDLFEHLSPEGIGRAIEEIRRVTKHGLCLHFFNMTDAPQDVIQQNGLYYWNRLSCQTMRHRIESSAGCRIDNCHLDSWLKSRYAYPTYYNRHAYTWRIDVT